MVVLAFDFKPSPASIADSSIQAADSATLVVDNATAGTAQASSNTHDIGLALVSYEREGFALPFEVVSILLLAALIGAIVLAKKEKLPINTELSDNTNNDSTL